MHVLTHTAEKPYKCNICDFATKQKGNLKTHMLSHSDERPFTCTFESCSFSTKRKSILQRHMLTHAEKKRYHCDKCKFRTNRMAELTAHKKIHLKVDFKCKVCGFSTSYKNVLAKHMFKFHTNMPFEYPSWDLNSRTVRWKDRLQTPIKKANQKKSASGSTQTQSKKKYHSLIYEPDTRSDTNVLSIMSVPELLDEINF